MFDLRGVDVIPIQKVIDPISKICNKVRNKMAKVIYVVHTRSPDLREVGLPLSGDGYGKSLEGHTPRPLNRHGQVLWNLFVLPVPSAYVNRMGFETDFFHNERGDKTLCRPFSFMEPPYKIQSSLDQGVG